MAGNFQRGLNSSSQLHGNSPREHKKQHRRFKSIRNRIEALASGPKAVEEVRQHVIDQKQSGERKTGGLLTRMLAKAKAFAARGMHGR